MNYAGAVETVSEQLIIAARQRTNFKLLSKEIGALLSHPWAFIANSESRTKRCGAWCQETGHAIGMPYWEIYGDWDDDPAKLRTDIVYLLR
jgi:hypothetical protein